MALSNQTDPKEAERALTEWLAGKMPEAQDVRVTNVVVPSSSGLSKETVLFDAAWTSDGAEHSEPMVARINPPHNTVFPDSDFGIEYRVMKALDVGTDVPVPTMHFYEEDKSIMGGEFITMNRVDGRIPSDDPPFTATGWVLEELSPEQRATMCQNALEAMTKVHAADWKSLGLEELVDGNYAQAGIDAQLDHWEHTFKWAAEGEPNPTVEAAIEWCRANRPADEGPQVLVWGDARVGNMIFADDLSIGAVLDWEMVTVANPELDLAWWLFMVRHHTEGIGAPLPEGFPTREETIANYEALTGYTAKDIDYYEVFSALRLSILMHRAGNMMIAAGLLPEDAPMKISNPASMLLAKMLELPAPGSEVQSFIGNR